jgi:penicillin-binding protein 1A
MGKKYPTMKSRASTSPANWKTNLARLLWLLNWGLLLLFFGGIGVMLGVYHGIAPLVPHLKELAELRINEGTKILSSDGQLLGQVMAENREFLPLEDIPQNVKNAVIAVEDTNFYHHRGVNPRGILRAMLKNLRAGQIKEGGSTITQQLARNFYSLRKRNIERKLQEFLLALEIERTFTKDEILELYLNEMDFGARAFGVKVAAKTYFNKAPGKLDLAECALLAGVLKGTTYFNPFRHPERAKMRRDFVLARMAEGGYITQEQKTAAQAEPLNLTKERIAHGQRAFLAPYFCAYVLQETERKFGEDAVSRGGLVIQTTLNWQIQQEAEKYLIAGVKGARGQKVSQGALLALDYQNGAIKAMVGGRDYSESEFNRATGGNRQVGSAFKPFVYTTAIDQGKSPSDYIDDSPVSYPDGKGGHWSPDDYDHSYRGKITLLQALYWSRNIPAVKLMDQVGVQAVITTARNMGMKGRLDPYLATALGSGSSTPLEMASAYAVIANGGYRLEPYAISEIRDASGGLLFEQRPRAESVLRQSTAQTMAAMMAEVIRRGTAAGAYSRAGGLPFFAAGKTGTTSEYRDAWFIGWGGGLSCAVWLGNDDQTKMYRMSGGGAPASIWMRFMKAAVPLLEKGREAAAVSAPDIEKIAATLEKQTKALPKAESPLPGEENSPQTDQNPELPPADTTGTPPDTTSPDARGEAAPTPSPRGETETVTICAVSGKLATLYCPKQISRTFPKGKAPKITCPLHPDPFAEH